MLRGGSLAFLLAIATPLCMYLCGFGVQQRKKLSLLSESTSDIFFLLAMAACFPAERQNHTGTCKETASAGGYL